MPIVLYPLLGVFANESVMWYLGTKDKLKQVVQIEANSPLAVSIASSLKGDKQLTVVTKVPHDEDLKSDRAAALIFVDSDRSKVTIKTRELANQFGTDLLKDFGSNLPEQIEGDIRRSRFEALQQDLKAKNIPDKYLNVFYTTRESLGTNARGPTTIDARLNVGTQFTALLVCFAITIMTLIGGPASVCMVSEEREKKTLHTTLLLPVQRVNLIVAKFLAIMFVTAAGTIYNLFCLIVFLLSAAMILWLNSEHFNIGQLLNKCQHLSLPDIGHFAASTVIVLHRIKETNFLPTASDIVWFFLIVFTSAAFLSSVYMCVAALARTVKEGQVFVTVPMVLFLPLPALCLIPGIHFNAATSIIPIANLMLLHKATNPSILLALVTWTEPFLLCAVLLTAVQISFFHESQSRRTLKEGLRSKA